jgi:hypothetical protein
MYARPFIWPRRRAVFPPSNLLPTINLLGTGRHRLDVEDGLQQAVDDLGLALLAGALDLLDLDLGLLVRLALGRLVARGVLRLELLELVLLVLAVGVYLLLGLVPGLADALGAEFTCCERRKRMG